MSKRRTWQISIWGLLAVGLLIVSGRHDLAAAPGPLSPTSSINWNPPLHTSTTAGSGAFFPVIQAAPTGKLMIMYNQLVGANIKNPFFRQRPAGSSTWSAPAKVHNNASTNLEEVAFAFDASSAAHAVWRVDSVGDYAIYHARQSQWPNGQNVIVDNLTEPVFDPAIVVGQNGDLYVAWDSNHSRIKFSFSDDNGATWSPPEDLTSATGSFAPSLAVDSSGNLHAVWEERILNPNPPPTFTREIQYKKGTLAGGAIVWQATPTILATGSGSDWHLPDISAAGSALHVSYVREVAQEEQYAYYSKFTSGSGWSSPRNATGGPAVSENASNPLFLSTSLTACDGVAYIFYHGATSPSGKEQVFGTSSGDNWTGRDPVTNGQIRNLYPGSLCVGQNMYLVYEQIEESGPNSGTNQIYFLSGLTGNGNLYLPAVFR